MSQEDDTLPGDKCVEQYDDRMSLWTVCMQVRVQGSGNLLIRRKDFDKGD